MPVSKERSTKMQNKGICFENTTPSVGDCKHIISENVLERQIDQKMFLKIRRKG